MRRYLNMILIYHPQKQKATGMPELCKCFFPVYASLANNSRKGRKDKTQPWNHWKKILHAMADCRLLYGIIFM